MVLVVVVVVVEVVDVVEVVVALYRASFLCQYFLEFAQSTSDTKWQMNVFWSKAVKLAHRKSYRVPNRQW